MSRFLDNVAKIAGNTDKPGRMIILGFDRQPLRDPDGSTNYIDIYSTDSEIARKYQRTIQNRRLAMRGRVKITAAELESEAIELLVTLTSGWGSIDKDGNEKADETFSAQAARELYSNPANSELRSQVDEFAGDRANFLPALSKNSLNSPSTISDKAAS